MTAPTRLQVLIETLFDGKGADTAERKFSGLTTQLTTFTAAAVAVGVAAKKAFEFGRQGAEVTQLGISFEKLEESISPVPDLLGRVEAATLGTIDRVTLQSGMINLVAGATDEWAGALLAASPRLAAISTAATTLNPTIGDTAKIFDDASIAIKRQSVLIADNLGLTISMENAVREVHPELRTLADSYDELTKQQKFLNEFLYQGDILIQQAGGSVASAVDPYDRLTTNVKNLWSAFVQLVDEHLVRDWVVRTNEAFDAGRGLIGGYNERMVELIASNITAEGTVDDLVDQYRRLESIGGKARLFGAGDEVIESFRDLRIALAASADSVEEYIALIEEAEGHELSPMLERTEIAFYENAKAIEEANTVVDGWSHSMASAREASAELEATEADSNREQRLEAQAAAFREQELQSIRAGSAIAAYNERVEAVAAANEAAIEAQERLNQGWEASGPLIDELATAQEGLAEASGEWVTVSRDNSTRIAGIQGQLAADLTTEQKQMYSELLSTATEGSAEWLGAWNALQEDLTDSQRNALVAQLADLEGAHGEMISAYTGNAAEAEEMQERVNAANEAIIESFRIRAFEERLALEGVTEANIAYGVQLGVISQAEADARLEYARTTAAIDELIRQEDFLTLAVMDQAEATEFLIDQMATNSEEAIALALAYDETTNSLDLSKLSSESLRAELATLDATETDITIIDDSVGTAKENVDRLRMAAEDAAGDYQIRFNIETSGGIPANGGYEKDGGTGGTNPRAFARGGYTGNTGGVVHPHELVIPRHILDGGQGAINQFATQNAPGVSVGDSYNTETINLTINGAVSADQRLAARSLLYTARTNI